MIYTCQACEGISCQVIGVPFCPSEKRQQKWIQATNTEPIDLTKSVRVVALEDMRRDMQKAIDSHLFEIPQHIEILLEKFDQMMEQHSFYATPHSLPITIEPARGND